ncbi:hypothetical protein G7Y89_g12597 [Cudoniella acicularis]|uniref:Major facilitator superfamily (MFS) profile domain-containing protein n=1 Tax=Cudoniella acicularis TaxID=354080 RepID=A0A8H4RB44_9HELO|nr:hypothetical protein G7Y89_g12597 [Cudoniella acicularis]
MMTTTNIGGLYVGRLLVGASNGLYTTFAQVYIQECSPPRYRGLLIGLYSTWASAGILVGSIVDNYTKALPGIHAYLIPLGIVYIIPGFLSISLFLIPESPRWLLQHEKAAKARKSVEWLNPYPELVNQEISIIQATLDSESNLAQSTEIVDMWKNPVDRRRTLLSVGAVTLLAATGSMYMLMYSTYFFEMAKIGSPFENTCIYTGIGVLATIINNMVITRFGRRRVMLMTGMVCCGICQLVLASTYTASPGTTTTGKVIVAFAVLQIVSFNGMLSTYALLCGGEFPSQRLRSYTLGIASCVTFLGAWLTTFTAPYFINPDALNWGPKYGYIWFPICLVGAAWAWLYLPEVKGRSFEEIDEMFEAHVPSRKFRGYRCVGIASVALVGEEEKTKDEAQVSHEEVGSCEEKIVG